MIEETVCSPSLITLMGDLYTHTRMTAIYINNNGAIRYATGYRVEHILLTKIMLPKLNYSALYCKKHDTLVLYHLRIYTASTLRSKWNSYSDVLTFLLLN